MWNLTRSIASLCALIAVCSVLGQAADPVGGSLPIISKRCLWNADKATWSKLGLKRDQVRKMEEIKLHYPAVVDGQWIATDVEVLDRTAIMDTSMMAAEILPADGLATLSVEDLQRELRAVLMPDQLNELGAMCGEHAQR